MNNNINFVDNNYIKSLIGVITRTFFEFNSNPKWDKLTAIYNEDPTYFSNNPLRFEGTECWPIKADSMIGVYRMVNIYESLKYVIKNNIDGDFVETGVWKGGACVLANAVIHEYNEELNRKVHVFDSFEGLPVPYMPQDHNDRHHQIECLSISLDVVQQVFQKYGYLTDNVIFRKGFFKDTMKLVDDIEKIAVLRLDGDMYSSTIEVLDALYDKVQTNGVIIVDDWTLPGCKAAIIDFCLQKNITPNIINIDKSSCYWIK